MLRIAICDDVQMYLETTSESVREWSVNSKIEIELFKFHSGEELLIDMEDKGAYDIILLDVELDGENGIGIAKKINKMNFSTLVIFISQYNYFQDAYDAYPFHFLGKPIDTEKLFQVLDDAAKIKKADVERITFQFNRKVYNVLLGEVEYFFSSKRVIHVMCLEEEMQFYGKLDEFELGLQPKLNTFLRVHKSYLVNSRHIKEYQSSSVVMRSGVTIPVSADRRAEVRKAHMKALEKR